MNTREESIRVLAHIESEILIAETELYDLEDAEADPLQREQVYFLAVGLRRLRHRVELLLADWRQL